MNNVRFHLCVIQRDYNYDMAILNGFNRIYMLIKYAVCFTSTLKIEKTKNNIYSPFSLCGKILYT